MYENYDFDNVGVFNNVHEDTTAMGPSAMRKQKGLKQTKIGLALLLGAIGCMFLQIMVSPIPCLGGLLSLGTLGLGIAAYVMMLIGANALERPHKALVISSLIIIGVAFLGAIIIAIMVVFSSMGNLMGGINDQGIEGRSLVSLYESVRKLALVGIIPNIMIGAAYVMVLFKPSKRWGRILIGVYLGVMIVFSAVSAYASYSLLGDQIDKINPDESYTTGQVQSIQDDVKMDQWMIGLLRAPELIVLMIIAFGAFFNVKNMQKDLEPKMDQRLYSLKI